MRTLSDFGRSSGKAAAAGYESKPLQTKRRRWVHRSSGWAPGAVRRPFPPRGAEREGCAASRFERSPSYGVCLWSGGRPVGAGRRGGGPSEREGCAASRVLRTLSETAQGRRRRRSAPQSAPWSAPGRRRGPDTPAAAGLAACASDAPARHGLRGNADPCRSGPLPVATRAAGHFPRSRSRDHVPRVWSCSPT